MSYRPALYKMVPLPPLLSFSLSEPVSPHEAQPRLTFAMYSGFSPTQDPPTSGSQVLRL